MHTAPRTVTMKSVDMDLKPFMNLMVVLIPMLLLSAEFSRVTVIDLKLPSDRGSTPSHLQKTPFAPAATDKLDLTALITDSTVTLGARGGFLPTLHYREYHRYTARGDHATFTAEYHPGEAVTHPVSGRAMSDQERQDILLYTCDDKGALEPRLYTQYGELVTDAQGNALAAVSRGDSVYALSFPRRLIVVADPQGYDLRPMSVYDALQNRLMKIKERYQDASDRDAIIIAAENSVIYDKIVQLMDTARKAAFPEISISKIRS
jgi:biopolymer transport protein ExbD